MPVPRETLRSGRDHLATVTELLQRVRANHPTAGLFEAADLQWWWRTPRRTDDVPQLFWFDDRDRPVAAAVLTDWGNRVAVDAIVFHDTTPDVVDHVIERGVQHATDLGFAPLSAEVDHEDDGARGAYARLGFELAGDGVVEAWLDTAALPDVAPLADGYRSTSRADTSDRPHHMVDRSGGDIAARLRETSLYREDLDLVVLDADDALAAYGLCWFDPVTRTGLVEPMRTEDAHQRRGLARHVLTRGVHLLADAGATRVKICYEDDNPASGHLYRSVGFAPFRRTVVMAR